MFLLFCIIKLVEDFMGAILDLINEKNILLIKIIASIFLSFLSISPSFMNIYLELYKIDFLKFFLYKPFLEIVICTICTLTFAILFVFCIRAYRLFIYIISNQNEYKLTFKEVQEFGKKIINDRQEIIKDIEDKTKNMEVMLNQLRKLEVDENEIINMENKRSDVLNTFNNINKYSKEVSREALDQYLNTYNELREIKKNYNKEVFKKFDWIIEKGYSTSILLLIILVICRVVYVFNWYRLAAVISIMPIIVIISLVLLSGDIFDKIIKSVLFND